MESPGCDFPSDHPRTPRCALRGISEPPNMFTTMYQNLDTPLPTGCLVHSVYRHLSLLSVALQPAFFFPFYVPVAVALSFLPFILSVSFLHCHFSCSYDSYNSPHFPFRLGYSIFLRCCRWEKGLVPLDITDTSGMTTLLVYWPTFYVVVVLVVSFSARSLNFSR